jgi:hypothetical protein
MKTLYAHVILATAATALACASIQPAPVVSGDRCLRCRQSIVDVRAAAEIIDNMHAPFPFRTAACLAKYVKANADTSFAAIYVTDHRTGRMLPASNAWFVPAQITAADGKHTEADYLAFGSRGDAEAFRAHDTPLLRWAQVVAESSTH